MELSDLKLQLEKKMQIKKDINNRNRREIKNRLVYLGA
jgi:hypothetical protein